MGEPGFAGLACGGEVVGWEGEEVGEVGLFGGRQGGEGFGVVVKEHGCVDGMKVTDFVVMCCYIWRLEISGVVCCEKRVHRFERSLLHRCVQTACIPLAF